MDQEIVNLTNDLNAALGRLPCIHGFRATARVEEVDGTGIKPVILFRCYECKQTLSMPPGLRDVVNTVIAKYSERFHFPANF